MLIHSLTNVYFTNAFTVISRTDLHFTENFYLSPINRLFSTIVNICSTFRKIHSKLAIKWSYISSPVYVHLTVVGILQDLEN
jgi:hypothetical protein